MAFFPGKSKAFLSTSTQSIKEGEGLVVTVKTEGVSVRTPLYWSIGGDNITSADVAPGNLQGSGSVGLDGSFAFKLDLIPDRLTEGTEKLIISLFSDSSLKTPIAEQVLEILDSSTAPVATPAYELTPSSTTLKEGGILTTTVKTKNVKPGTTLFWQASGIDSADLEKGELKGSGVVGPDGSFAFSHSFLADNLKEGNELLSIGLFTDSSRSKAVAKTSVAITDGSDPKPPVARFNPTPETLKEGDGLTLTGVSQNLEPGTTLYWNLNRQRSDATLKDFKILVPDSTIHITYKC